jgi:hypothetical protein
MARSGAGVARVANLAFRYTGDAAFQFPSGYRRVEWWDKREGRGAESLAALDSRGDRKKSRYLAALGMTRGCARDDVPLDVNGPGCVMKNLWTHFLAGALSLRFSTERCT